jgi:hypothetical protein
MNARVLIVAIVSALALPASATAEVMSGELPTPKTAKHVAKRHVAPRVLCICVTGPAGGALPAESEVQVEAETDADLISQGLDPAYPSFQTTPEQQAEYDAVLAAHGLSRYFDAPPIPQSTAD